MKEDQDDWFVNIHHNLHDKNTSVCYYDINQYQYDLYNNNININYDSNSNNTTDIDTNWNDPTQYMHLPYNSYADQFRNVKYLSNI